MYSRRRIRWVVGGAVVGVLTLVAAFQLLSPGERDTADQIGSVLSAAAGWIALWAVAGTPARRADTSEDVLDRLADLVGRQWEREAVRRGLRGTSPMRIRWRITERPVGVPPDEVTDLGPARVTRLRLAGEVQDLAETWRRLPFRRLVVIGRPGAGKTSAAVLLTCGLLADRRPGEPVAVLLDLAGWRPSSEEFEAWLGRTLAGRYGLRAAAREAGRLVAERGVIAVLDGLDEMRPEDRAAAVTVLNELVDLPLVVMSRAEEYTATVTETGEPLHRALIVELDPLSPQQAAGYLPGGQAGDADRWAPVARELVRNPSGPLAVALSSPLMTYLARTVYRVPGSDPAELIELAEGGELERRLFDRYLPALYPERGAARSRFAAGRAAAWLRFLARHLDRQAQQDFAWWRIGWVSGKPIAAARVAVLPGIVVPFLLFFALTGEFGIETLLFAAAIFGFGYFLPGASAPEEPRQLRFQARRLRTAAVGGILFVAPMMFAQELLFPVGPWVVMVLSVASVVVALWATRSVWREVALWGVWLGRGGRPRNVAPVLLAGVQGPAMAFLAGLALCLVLGLWNDPEARDPLGPALFIAVTMSVGLGVPLGLVFGLASAFIRPAPVDELWDPERTLRGDRAALLVPPLLIGAVAMVGVGAGGSAEMWDLGPAPFWYVVRAGLIAGALGWFVAIALGSSALSAWLTYTVVRLWFAARGWLPWRLMPFLADAARRGVLRRNGAVYQFRHERLRGHLAEAGGVRRLE
ncbi:hypothetical protein [Actinoplanes sichuanensis]|uniref:NACHT domain-containing protein n=1 Tax=Actinoplanes sichuanensis TaxID=512349 RepID=A0ABW4A5Y2_9ACTN|nr:hypothetical protein [Actinoplanes sichuanensis]